MKFKKITASLGLATIAVAGLASCSNASEDSGTHTYNYSSSVFPTNWNPHTYQTATDADILDTIVSGFYEFDYNEAKDGYKLVPGMAKAEPTDVTSSYVGEKWGIASGETGRAYKIDLRDDLKWEDGTDITAADFVESAKLLLNPDADNYRADNLYSGSLVVVNAKNYLYQGQKGYFASDDVYDEYTTSLDSSLVFSLESPSVNETAYNGAVSSVRPSLGATDENTGAQVAGALVGYIGGDLTVESLALLEGKTLAQIKADETYNKVWEALIRGWQTEPNEELDFFITYHEYVEMDFTNVGVIDDNGDLVIVLTKELTGFSLLYNLTSSWLVNTDLYESCQSTSTDGIYQNSYGTAVENTISYGPYKLTFFQADKEYRFEKNEYWYGYNDPENADLYETDRIVCQYVKESSTALNLFNTGQLDTYSLTADDMATYSQSESLYYTEGASTFFIALNPNLSNLESTQAAAGTNINKTILTNLKFRQALSFAVDRAAFCLAASPVNSAATAVFNNLIISNPETGASYRTSEEAKDVILNFWGLTDEVGAGKTYATKDDAIAAITGVDLAQAKALFTEAYNEARTAGLLDADDTIELKIGLPNGSNPFYFRGYEYLVNCWTDAVKGTSLEGKLTFTKDDTLGNGFADALRNNSVDILFGVGWSGSALDPYNLVSAYTDPDYQYDQGINYKDVYADVHFDSIKDTNGTTHTNVTLRASVADWANKALTGDPITVTELAADGSTTTTTYSITAGSSLDYETRSLILYAVEGKILEQYTMLPLTNQSSATLKSMKINYYTEEYIYGIGRGGYKYITYNYTDTEWTNYVNSLGGNLNYK